MMSELEMFKVLGAFARHAAESQRVAAENIANADLPGYKAVELESFSEFFARTSREGEVAELAFVHKSTNTPVAPNGNSVSIEHEMIKTAQAAGQHSLALTSYTKMLDLLRTAAGVRQ